MRVLAIVVMVAGAIMVVAGVFTWFAVQTQLADEKITVSDDAENFAGDPVDGPLTAGVRRSNVIESTPWRRPAG